MPKILLENKHQIRTKKSRKKFWVIFSIIVAVLILATGGYFYAKARGIFTKNYSDPTDLAKKIAGNETNLKGEGDGRINILLLGYGGAGHDGAYLTDSIEVISIDPVNKQMAMLSIPRDFYVQLKSPYYAGKINAVYGLGKPVSSNSKYDGANLIKQEVSTILDLPIDYYVAMDFSGFQKAIDNIGGIDVYVSPALYDNDYPVSDKSNAVKTLYISAGQHHMDGALALEYARSRETTSDFSRSQRQQKVISAFKDKLLSNGTLANPVKLVSLVNTLGSSVRTDFQPSEIEALAGLMKSIDTSNIKSEVLDNSANGVLAGYNCGGADCLAPKAGLFNYTQIQEVAHKLFTDPELSKESAKIEITNSSGTNGVGNDWSTLLTAYGYNIVDVKTGTTTSVKTQIIDYSGGSKKYTLQFLSQRLGATIVHKSRPAGSTLDLEIIIGKDNKEAYAGING